MRGDEMTRTLPSDISRDNRTIVLRNNERFQIIRVGEWMQEYEGGLVSRMQELLNEQIEIQNQILQEQLRHNLIGFNVIRIKKPLLDILYPHKCPACGRKLKFLELILADGNLPLKQEFKKKTWDFIDKYYSNFDFYIKLGWCEIFSEHEYQWHLRKLWKSKHVEFVCCKCFRILETKNAINIFENGEFHDLRESLENDICEGLNLTREELFGERDETQD